MVVVVVVVVEVIVEYDWVGYDNPGKKGNDQDLTIAAWAAASIAACIARSTARCFA